MHHSLPQWKISIPSHPWSKSGRRIESLCRKALYDFNMIEEKDHTIAIALSGGKDSLSLLFLLHAISGRGFPPFKLHAMTVSGAYSCGPSIATDYIQKVCLHLGIPLDILVQQGAPPTECYGCSRTRRSLLFKRAHELGISKIAFGHHRDDSIQTLLLNLLHKGEFAANLPKVPMHLFGIEIIRPLIYVPEEDIIAFAKQNNFLRIMCQCPIGAQSQRAVTKKILESLESHFPNTRKNLMHASLRYGSDKAKSIRMEPSL